MAVYQRNGLSYFPTSEEALDLHKKLPVGNYIIKQNPMTNALYFEQVDSFPEFGKLYGNILSRTDRIINTYQSRAVSTGVLLAGEKGSGKTQLAKNISKQAAKQGIPTIIINAPWCGDQFNQLIQGISQEAIIMFDEFEKVYDSDDQEKILTLMDGVFPTKKLFLLTCNNQWRIDSHMRNRPGRLFYMLEFKGLDDEFIREYCQDNLKDKGQIESVSRVAALFDQFNFDLLKALVEEMNRYNETAVQALEMLNAKPNSDDSTFYDVELKLKNMAFSKEAFYPNEWRGTPVGREEFEFTINSPQTNNAINEPLRELMGGAAHAKVARSTSVDDELDYCYDEDDNDGVDVQFLATDLVNVDPKTGTFTYKNADGYEVKFTRRAKYSFSYKNFDAF